MLIPSGLTGWSCSEYSSSDSLLLGEDIMAEEHCCSAEWHLIGDKCTDSTTCSQTLRSACLRRRSRVFIIFSKILSFGFSLRSGFKSYQFSKLSMTSSMLSSDNLVYFGSAPRAFIALKYSSSVRRGNGRALSICSSDFSGSSCSGAISSGSTMIYSLSCLAGVAPSSTARSAGSI